jgi:hypothetical protein
LDSSYIELPGTRIGTVSRDGATVRVRLEPALIIKRMTGSKERTRWRQDGTLILEGVPTGPGGAPTHSDRLDGPRICTTGTIDDNLYSYRDMIPIPWISRGRIRCELALEGQTPPLTIDATAVRLEMEGVPKYIEHLRP